MPVEGNFIVCGFCDRKGCWCRHCSRLSAKRQQIKRLPRGRKFYQNVCPSVATKRTGPFLVRFLFSPAFKGNTKHRARTLTPRSRFNSPHPVRDLGDLALSHCKVEAGNPASAFHICRPSSCNVGTYMPTYWWFWASDITLKPNEFGIWQICEFCFKIIRVGFNLYMVAISFALDDLVA